MKKKTVYIMLSVMITLAFPGCGKSSNVSDKTEKVTKPVVKVGFSKGSLCSAPVHIAYLNGYFEEEFKAADTAWKYEEVDLAQAAELLAAGKINAAYGLTASLIQPIDNGLDIAFTTGLHTGCTKYYVKADSKINSAKDLKGAVIGVPGLSDSSTMNMKRKLLEVGIGASTKNMEVTFSEYAMQDLPLALDKGAVDAIALHDPVAYQAEEQYGFKKILDTGIDEKFKNEYCCQAYVTTELATKHPEAAAAYTRALQKAAAFIQANPKKAAKIQKEKEFCQGELEINAKLLKSYNYSPSVSAGLETFKSCVNELKKIGDLNETTDAVQFISKHYITLMGVPDSMTFHEESNKFTEVVR